jgi:hypothetical protein
VVTMKISLVLESLREQAIFALTGFPSIIDNRPIYTFNESFSVLLSLSSVAGYCFGFSSDEYEEMTRYRYSLEGTLFVGPVQS